MNNCVLSIIIPAYNEEAAIAAIIERCLNERTTIIRETPINEVEIIVVNDGSQDRTAEVARQYKDISLINFEKNRGYGAALKSGFERARGNLVSFLDADGTCDPKFLIDLCNALFNEDADMAVGYRLGPGNRMPLVRRIGNRAYVMLINLLGKTKITDSASGMRVLRRECLPKIYPLPDGLHFTPAMSCRAAMDERIKIVEVPISYQERKGKSKLSVVYDGIRFLKTIVDIALMYEPIKFFGSLGILLFLLAIGYGIYPMFYYLRSRMIPEYMIYRLITVITLTFTSFTLFTVGVISEQISDLIMKKRRVKGILKKSIYFLLSQKKLILVGPTIALLGIVLNYNTIWQYLSTGEVYVHWVYIVTGAFLFLVGVQALALGVLERIVSTLKEVQTLHEEYRSHFENGK